MMKAWLIFAISLTALLLAVSKPWEHSMKESAAKFPGTIPANQVTEIDGAAVTAVVVTQCNGLLAVYLTMPSGNLLRFDKDSGLPWTTLLDMANAAVRSERIEVSCDSLGVEGYEGQAETVSLTFM